MRIKNKGSALIEVAIASAIILGAVVSIVGAQTLYLKVALANSDSVKAAYLAQEGIEAVRFLRDNTWRNNIAVLSTGVDYGIMLNGNSWVIVPNFSSIDNFKRSVSFGAVYRDETGSVTLSGGIIDPDTVLVTSKVTWDSRGTSVTKSISSYLVNIYGN